MFRFIGNVLSFLGYLLLGMLVFFSFYPLKKTSASSLKMDDFFVNCQPNSSSSVGNDYSYIIEQLEKSAERLNDALNFIGSRLSYDLESCLVEGIDVDEAVEQLKNFFVTRRYTVSDTNEHIVSINKLPFLELFNIKVSTRSLIVATNYCTNPVTSMSIYIVNWNLLDNDGLSAEQRGKYQVNLLRVSVNEVETVSQFQKSLKNLLETTHYFKYQLKCK